MVKALSGTVIELLAFAAIIALLMGGGWGRVVTKEPQVPNDPRAPGLFLSPPNPTSKTPNRHRRVAAQSTRHRQPGTAFDHEPACR